MGATHQTGSEPAGRVAGSDSQSQRLTPCVSPLGSDVAGLACPSGREKWRPPTAPVMRAGIAPASGFAQTVLRLCSVTEPYIRCVSLSTPPHRFCHPSDAGRNRTCLLSFTSLHWRVSYQCTQGLNGLSSLVVPIAPQSRQRLLSFCRVFPPRRRISHFPSPTTASIT